MTKDSAAIRDQLGNDPDTIQLLNANYDETIEIIELATVISAETLGNSWIVGSLTNGIVGTNLNTENGLQQVVGASGREQAIVRIINPNNTFREFFRDEDFLGDNNADWNTTLFRLAMTTATDKSRPYATSCESKTIFSNSENISKATFNCDETRWGEDVINYFLSSDDGITWEQVVKGAVHLFTTKSTKLKFKVAFIGNGANETFIENLRISYSVV